MTKIFNVQLREKSGTGAARMVRRQDMVPGIVYGNKQEPQMISMSAKDIALEYTTKRFFSTLYNLDINGKKVDVLVKDVQLHPVTDRALHIDFIRVDKNSLITVAIPVRYINEDKSPALKRGGLLNIVIHELEVKCPPQNIPHEIVVDLNGIEGNKSIHLDEIQLDKNVKAAYPLRDSVVATIVVGKNDDASSEE
ncbi:MAG: 50S ribosomal protein L25/general stress protein Ctc [Proteobacteria bacterium]|nr:50S ribosomal protein L25/general stress protein Ctc [Pseudomonadota bacterium]